MGKGWGRCFFCQIEPKFPLPYTLVEGFQASGLGYLHAVYAQIQYRGPKTGEQEVQLSCKDDTLCPSGYKIYLW